MTYRLKLSKIIIIIFIILPFSLIAQKLDRVLGDILIQLRPEASIHQIEKDFQTFQFRPTQIEVVKAVVPHFNIWKIHIDYTQVNERDFLEKIKTHPNVRHAQFNHLLQQRSIIPNDPEFSNQWQHLNDGNNGDQAGADMDTDLAWATTTGGLTPTGDTIVICIIDAGIDGDHDDLKNNLWVNHAEIPDNGIDDDNNGFTDDYLGWNSFTDTDNVYNNDDHGTAVAGIIGAQGNNNLGVAGINWNIQMMIVQGGSGAEDEALESYAYPLSHRIKYNNTNGAEGAFVVATNASWGVDQGDPDEFPLWCAFYDTLGVHGILNCGATANNSWDVEIEGDMPTGCTSDYLVGVTNTNSSDELHFSAAFGATSIDLGAPGALTYTTAQNNSYDTFNGTSAATAQVGGAIGLLYAAPCTNVANLAKNDPSAAALQIKQYLLNGVDAIPSLDGNSVTGGRLNIVNSMQLLMDNCGDCPAPSSLYASQILDTSVVLSWINADSTLATSIRYRPLPAGDWIELQNVNSPYLLTTLAGCTGYEVQVAAACSSTESGYTYSHFFTTEDCCVPPADLAITAVTDNSVTLTWSEIFAAHNYHLTLDAIAPDLPPITHTTIVAETTIQNIESCTIYEISIQVECDTGFTAFTAPIIFETTGCGICKDSDYCTISSDDASSEWIQDFSFHTLINDSGNDGGYGNFTDLPSTEVEAGQTYPIEITPGYSGANFLEYFRVWIDYNQDGDFGDEGEIVLSTPDDVNVPVNGNVTIPPDAVPGPTRMRVLMRWGGGNQNNPPPCEDIDFGEIEDYCVTILGGNGVSCLPPESLDTLDSSLSTLHLSWEMPSTVYDSFVIEYRKEGTTEWATVTTTDLEVVIPDLEKCTNYEARVQADCNAVSASDFSPIQVFNTRCDVSIADLSINLSKVEILPNPFEQNIVIHFTLTKQTHLQLEIFTANGQLVFEQSTTGLPGENTLSLTTLINYPSGVYFLKLKTERAFVVRKMVKE